MRARSVGHVNHRALHFDIGKIGVDAFGRHDLAGFLNTIDGALREGLVALLDGGSPLSLVADLGCAGDPRLVTGLAQRLKDLLAGKIAFRAARIRHRDLAEGLDARQELTLGFRVSRRFHVGDKLRKRYDQSDWYREAEHDGNDQLLMRLDECGLAVAHSKSFGRVPKGGIAERAL